MAFPATDVPGWLKPFVLIDPLFYGVDALRQVMLGTSGMFPIIVDLLALGLITIVAMAVSIFSFRRL